MRHTIIVCLMAFSSATPLVAHSSALSPTQREAAERAAAEYAECAAFFQVVQAGFASAQRAAESMKFKAIADKAKNFAVIAAQQSRSDIRSERVTQARIDLHLTAMNKVAGPDLSRLAPLMDHHATPCVQAVTQTGAPEIRWGVIGPSSRP